MTLIQSNIRAAEPKASMVADGHIDRSDPYRTIIHFQHPATLKTLKEAASEAAGVDPTKYMLRVFTSVMEPRFQPGEMLIVNREGDVNLGDFVVIGLDFVVIGLEAGNHGKIGRLIAQTDESVTYQHLSPARSFTIARKFIKFIHRIDGCYTPL